MNGKDSLLGPQINLGTLFPAPISVSLRVFLQEAQKPTTAYELLSPGIVGNTGPLSPFLSNLQSPQERCFQSRRI